MTVLRIFCPVILVFHVITGELFIDNSQTPFVTVSTGKIKGYIARSSKNNSARIFLGVPFAASPTGDRRFRPPLPPERWSGTLDCTKIGPACPQDEKLLEQQYKRTTISEDCLFLNIYAGINCTKSSLCPVIYYIFGGVFYFGAAGMYHKDADKILDTFTSPGIVFIMSNYRLGSLAFWGTGKPDAPKNAVFYDMIQALRWIKEEIHSFGGNPKAVTIMGHSSGSMTLAALSLSPKSKGLFHRATFMAGPAQLNDCESIHMELAVRLNCSTVDLWNKGDSFEETSECMRHVPLHKLLVEQTAMYYQGKYCIGAQNDGPDGLFPTSLKELRSQREPYDTLLGDTQREYGNVHGPFDESDKGVVKECANQAVALHYKAVKQISELCPAFFDPKFDSRTDELKEIFDSFWFAGMIQEATTMRDAGANVYLYSFDYVHAGLERIVPFHAYEIDWLFHPNSPFFNFTKEDEKIGNYWRPLITNFVKYGNPTPWNDGLPKFQKLKSPVGFNYYCINLPEPKNRPFFHQAVTEFWTGIAPAVDSIFSPFVHGRMNLAADSESVARVAFELQSSTSYIELMSNTDAPNLGPSEPSSGFNIEFFIVIGASFVLLSIVVALGLFLLRKWKRKKGMFIDLDLEIDSSFEVAEKSRLLNKS